MYKYATFFLFLSIPLFLSGQTIIWSEDFNNGCTDNCNADSYSGPNGAWTVVDVTTPGNFANQWFVSCAENGQPTGTCGAGCGNNATLHVGSVPCTLCLTCPTGDCGAAYNAGPSSLTGEDPTTNKRVISPLISTLGRTNISLHFKYIELGNNALDDAIVEFSIDGGASWLGFTNTPKTPTTCPGQGFWTSFSSILPSICENIPNFRLAIRWVNNDDGIGNDPSFAVDDIELSVPSATLPHAAFTTSGPASGCDSVCIAMTNTSTGNPTQWTWTCPGATNPIQSSSSPQPFCFTASGTYTFKLKVQNSNGADSTTQTVTVSVIPSPQPALSANDTVLCLGDCIGFTNLTSGSVTSSTWNFPGGIPASSNALNPSSICYANSGTYAVTLTINNGSCASSVTHSNYISVNAAVVPTISAAGNTLSSSPAQTYQWYSLQNGLITGATQSTYTATQPGDYYVVTTDAKGCSAQSASVNMAAPVAGFSPASINPGCDTTCASLTDSSTGNPTQWSWSCPGAVNPSQNGSSPAPFCFTASGTYTVTLTTSNPIGSSTFSQPLTVALLPAPVVSFATGDPVLCEGECTAFTNQTTGTIASVSWSFPGGNPASSTSAHPSSVCFANSGTYDVSLTVSNGSCSSTLSVPNYIAVNAPIVPVITVNGTLLSCSPAVSYQWYSVQNGLIAGATLSTYSAIPGEEYYVVVMDTNGCSTQSAVVSLAGPSAGFQTTGSSPGCDTTCVTLADNSTGNPFQWTWSCPGAVNPVQTGSAPAPFCFTQSGTYPVTLTVNNGGGIDSVTQSVVVTMLTLPDVLFSSGDSILCTGDCTGFINLTSGTVVSSSWFFSGGTPSTSSSDNPQNICYSTAGV
ncbi:MAG TPA: PKD domain-containing protein, partial [Bacteroidia bacterium]|nr:PKD domain-containing protein [Bacteroidia bacterium]